MIIGYKKKKLGHLSEKLSGNVPRAGWRAVFWSEIVFPICMAILFVIAYIFVKSVPDPKYPPSPLIRIAVISNGPIVWNAVVLLVLLWLWFGITCNVSTCTRVHCHCSDTCFCSCLRLLLSSYLILTVSMPHFSVRFVAQFILIFYHSLARPSQQ